MPVDATALIGLLVGFLVVGVIGDIGLVLANSVQIKEGFKYLYNLFGQLSKINNTAIYVGDQMITAADLETNASLYESQQSVIDTFKLGVTLCKIIVIVSVASVVFLLLQKTGLIPRFGQE